MGSLMYHRDIFDSCSNNKFITLQQLLDNGGNQIMHAFGHVNYKNSMTPPNLYHIPFEQVSFNIPMVKAECPRESFHYLHRVKDTPISYLFSSITFCVLSKLTLKLSK